MMVEWFYKHRALIGYVFIVVVAVVAVEFHHLQTTKDLTRHDARSCAQRNRLAVNQRVVLHAVSGLIQLELDEDRLHAGDQSELLSNLKDLHVRLQTAGPEAC